VAVDPPWPGEFFIAIRILRHAHEERATAYSMNLPESNKPSEEKQLKILSFAIRAEGEHPSSDGDVVDE
jgi:hypothetical protein